MKTIKQGRWQLTEKRVEGRLQWHLSSSDTLVTIDWPREEWMTVMRVRLETDDGIDEESLQTLDLPAWIKRLDPELDYAKLCESLEDM